MESVPELSGFATVLLFILAALVFLILGFSVSRFIRPSHPNPEKLSPYECGEEAVGSPWSKFNSKFYIIALIFLVFEVELLLLFPWSVVSADKILMQKTHGVWAWFVFTEVLVFVGILALGLIYAWAKGYLDWIKPEQKTPIFRSPIPDSYYKALNEKFSGAKAPGKN